MFTAMDGWTDEGNGPGDTGGNGEGHKCWIVDGWLEIDKERIYNYLYLWTHSAYPRRQIIEKPVSGRR